MSAENPQHTPRTSTVHRLFTGVLGVLIVGSGVYAMRFVSSSGMFQFVGAAVLIVLGVNMVFSALRARESWMSKIGPLP
jgi:uncharacterized membrane protein HdeD (DUF308 family)